MVKSRIRALFTRKAFLGLAFLFLSAIGRLGDWNTAAGLPEVAEDVWDVVESPFGYWIFLALGIVWLARLVARPSTQQEKPTLVTLDARTKATEKALDSLIEKVDYIEWVAAPPSPHVNVRLLSFENTEDSLVAHLQFATNIVETIVEAHLEVSGQNLLAEQFEPLSLGDHSTLVARFPRPSWLVAGEYDAVLYATGGGGTEWGKHRTRKITIS